VDALRVKQLLVQPINLRVFLHAGAVTSVIRVCIFTKVCQQWQTVGNQEFGCASSFSSVCTVILLLFLILM